MIVLEAWILTFGESLVEMIALEACIVTCGESHVRSRCHRAVAPTLACFSSGLAVLGVVASCWKLSSCDVISCNENF